MKSIYFNLRLTKFFFALCFAYLSFIRNVNGQSNLEISIIPNLVETDMNWSIAGNIYGNSPNILSELNFRDILSFGGNTKIKYRPIKHLYLIGKLGVNKTIEGVGNDTDYLKDNRTEPSYILNFNSSKGYSSNYSVSLFSNSTQILFLDIGLTYEKYTHKFSLLSEEHPNLDSYYRYNTKRFGIVTAKNIPFKDWLSMNNEILITKVNYKSMANWNLIKEFQHPKSFEHIANGYLLGFGSSIQCKLSESVDLNIQVEYQYERIGTGLDKAFLKTEEPLYSQFNGARRSTKTLGVGVSYKVF